jgi:hypothetical protein
LGREPGPSGRQLYQQFLAEIVRQSHACGLIEGQSISMEDTFADASLDATVSRFLQE